MCFDDGADTGRLVFAAATANPGLELFVGFEDNAFEACLSLAAS